MPPDCFVTRGSISPCKYFLTVFFYVEALLTPRPTPKLEDHPSSAVHDCLFIIFAATLHIGGRSSIRNLRPRCAVMTGTHRNIHKYTWTSPDGKTHNQIYHILIDRRRHSSILDVRSFRGTDCDTDHYLVVEN